MKNYGEVGQYKLFDEVFNTFDEATNGARLLYEENGYETVVDVNADGKFIILVLQLKLIL